MVLQKPWFFFCNLFSINFVNIQLLTYTPDEGLASEDFEALHEEHEPSLPSDSTSVLSEETQPSPQPPNSAETPQNIFDTDDLLVKYALLLMILIFRCLCHFYSFVSEYLLVTLRV